MQAPRLAWRRSLSYSASQQRCLLGGELLLHRLPNIQLSSAYGGFPSRVLTFLIALLWVCLQGTSAATRVAVCIVLGICALLIAWVISKADWQAQWSVSMLSAKMKQMEGLVKKAPIKMVTSFRTMSQQAMSVLQTSSASRVRTSGTEPAVESQDISGNVGHLQVMPYGSDELQAV